METKIALLVIYNHRYDKNIPRVQALYSDRFSFIYHVVPFYDGDLDGVNVIPVYESSYFFQGYISQAFKHLKGQGFSHYFVIADDLIVNPGVNEDNIWNRVGVNQDECFMPSNLIVFQKMNFIWNNIWYALTYSPDVSGVEIMNILPSKQEAIKRFTFHHVPTGRIPLKSILNVSGIKNIVKNAIRHCKWNRNLSYPLVGCYSDIYMVTAEAMNRFVTYCGAFAATNLFVEIATPTALLLASDKVKFDCHLKLHDGSLWSHNIHTLDKYNNCLDSLIKDFPEDKLFIHPVKLSKWH